MPKVVIAEKAGDRGAAESYSFTVVFEPLTPITAKRRKGRVVRRAKNSSWLGYQVTVPLLPGLIRYGRTLAEARRMAQDAIRCYLEGLQKDGERIPDEKRAIQEKVRVALSA